MKGDMYIIVGGVNIDLYTTYGISMGDGFLDELEKPLPMKELVSNEGRTANGVQYYIDTQRAFDSIEHTFNFRFVCRDAEELRTNKTAFFEELYKGLIILYIPKYNVKLRLLYTGKNATYKTNRWRNTASVSIKFVEPNPTNRE